MKVDYITIYSPDGAKTFKSDPNDSSDELAVEECGVDFLDNGGVTPYVKDKGEMAVFVGFPFYYIIKTKEAENGNDGA